MEIKFKIYKKSKSNKWTLNYIHPDTDKRIRKSFLRRRDALTYIEDFKNQYIQNRELIVSGKTINVTCTEYLSKYPESKLTKTMSILSLFLDHFGDVEPHKIDTKDIKTWLLDLKEKKNLTFKSISNYKGQINVLFKYLLREGYISTNPCEGYKVPYRGSLELNKVLSPNELSLIFENLFYYSPFFLYRFLWLMFKLDLTKNQLCEIKWSHVDFESRKLNVVAPRASHIMSIDLDNEVFKFIQAIPRRNEYLLTNRLGKKVDRNLICRRILKFREQYPNTPRFGVEEITYSTKHYKKSAIEVKI